MWYNSYTAKLNIKPRGKSCAVKGAAFFLPAAQKNRRVSAGRSDPFAVKDVKNIKNLLTNLLLQSIIRM